LDTAFFYAEPIIGLYEQNPNYQAAAQQIITACRRFRQSYPLSESRLMVWEGLYQQVRGKPKQAKKLWQAALLAAQKRQMPYDEALAYFYMDKYGDKSLLQKAATLFQEIGALWDYEHALRFLCKEDL